MEKLFLRKAVADDEAMLLRWANDPDVRAASFETHHITETEHHEWFGRMMADECSVQYILMNGDEPVGQCRLTINGDEAEIDYSIAPENRGMGYGKVLIALIEREVYENIPAIKMLVAKVKPQNAASAYCFETNGFYEKYECYVYLVEHSE